VPASKLVVISGGPGAGKTTVLLELERRGFATRLKWRDRSFRSRCGTEAMRFRGATASAIAG
jgi:broad-specificity NMP kinase